MKYFHYPNGEEVSSEALTRRLWDEGEQQTITYPVMLDSPCDRCKRVYPELHAFKLQEVIWYRGRAIECPWLCKACFKREKLKWWREQRRREQRRAAMEWDASLKK